MRIGQIYLTLQVVFMRSTVLQSIALAVLIFVSACSAEVDRASSGKAAPALSQTSPKTLHLLVLGGTSGTGLETVKLALQRGHQVTAMARRPSRMTLTHDNLSTIKGDVMDIAPVEAAVAGMDVVIMAIGIGPTQKHVTVFSHGTANVLAAMDKSGVRRLMVVTGIGAGDSKGHGGFFYDYLLQPLLLRTLYADKDRAELLLKESVLDWTIVRPGFLTDEAGQSNYRVITDLEGITSGDIARADVAHYMIAAVEAGGDVRSTVLLSN